MKKPAWILPTIIFLSLAQSTFASESPVECESLDACPDFILQIINDGNHGCTGALVGRDVVATNLHCIPEDLRKEGANCEDRIKIFFPKTKYYDAETVRCKKILALSPPLGDTPITPDYAFFKVDRDLQRPFAGLSNEGFADQEEIIMYKVDPKPKPPHIVKKQTCTAVQNSMANPTFSNRLSPVIAMIPCEIIPGNSGAPMLSKNFEIKGVVSASTEGTHKDTNFPLFEKAGFGSNFSCLNIPGLLANTNTPAECKNSLSSSELTKANGVLLNRLASNIKKTYAENAVLELKSLQKQTKDFIFWDFDEKLIPLQNLAGKVSELSYRPKCIAFSKEMIKRNSAKLASKPVIYGLSFTKWSLEVKVDHQARPIVDLKPNPYKSNFVFTPSDLKSLEPAEIEFENQKIKIPFCVDQKT
jgi:hypothetical protein